jgi:hypothetical protein
MPDDRELTDEKLVPYVVELEAKVVQIDEENGTLKAKLAEARQRLEEVTRTGYEVVEAIAIMVTEVEHMRGEKGSTLPVSIREFKKYLPASPAPLGEPEGEQISVPHPIPAPEPARTPESSPIPMRCARCNWCGTSTEACSYDMVTATVLACPVCGSVKFVDDDSVPAATPGAAAKPAERSEPPAHVVTNADDCVSWCRGCQWRVDQGLPLDWAPPAPTTSQTEPAANRPTRAASTEGEPTP